MTTTRYPAPAMQTFRPRASAPLTHAPATRSAQSRQQPPCAGSPNTWDLDAGTPDSWRTAVATCRSCPLFAECGRQAQALIARGDGPRAVIWAGVAYDNAGKVVENLDGHRTNSVDNRRPLRIIRHGVRPESVEPAPAAPRRHLVLGRPLRPTGTGAF
jgi:hypothetical protein